MLGDQVRSLIQLAIPNTDALEVLMLLAGQPGKCWRGGEVVSAVHSQALEPTAIAALFVRFDAAHLGTWQPDAGFTWAPAAQVQPAVNQLIDAYHRQPVTLIRTVYEIADIARIQALADAFRIKKDET